MKTYKTSFFLTIFFLALISTFNISNVLAMNEEEMAEQALRKGFIGEPTAIDSLEDVPDEGTVKFDKERRMYYLGNSLDSLDGATTSSTEVSYESEDYDDLDEGLQKLLEARDSTNNVLKDVDKIKMHESLMRDKDRRTKIGTPHHVPYLSNGQLVIDFGGGARYIGSGTLIAERVVLTAAHNLYDRKTKRRAEEVIFYAGKDGLSAVAAGRSEALEFPTEWASDEASADAHDIGIVVLSRDFEEKYRIKELSHYSICSLSDDSFAEKIFSITGYPGAAFIDGCLRLINGNYMFGHSGPHISLTPHLIHYNIDTSPGQSGSAIWFQEGKYTFCCAVHVRGGPKGHTYNVGTRINEEKHAMILQWLKAYK
ncbi:MAG: hypothetical protein MRY83_18635 [Flavobacteriales bacterium]|nr:hypothetical protein [Flavobacteriales bacterium]